MIQDSLELYLQLQTNRKLYYDYREVSFTVTHNEDFMGSVGHVTVRR